MDLPGISKKLVADVQKIMSAQRVAEAAVEETVEVEKLDENVIEETDEYEFLFVDETGLVEALEVTDNHVELMFEDGIERISTDDILVREVENLEEISKSTLQSYVKGAEASVAATVKKGKPSKAVVALRAKRGSGLEAAKAKLQAIYKKEFDARKAKMRKISSEADDHFKSNHVDILKRHGYVKLHSGQFRKGNPQYSATVTTYHHNHPNGQVSLISVHEKHDPGANLGYRHEVKAMNSKGTSYSSHYPNSDIWHEDPQKIKDHKDQILPNFEHHVIKVKNDTSRDDGW